MNKVTVCGIDTNLLPRLSNSEIMSLLESAHSGDKSAREALVVGNMRLVLSLCQRYAGRRVNFDDLFQVGCVGLLKSIDNFNTALDVRFSTYAVPMIIGEMRRLLRDNNSFRVTRSLRDTAYKALQAREKLEREHTREVTMDDIAEELELPLSEVVCALDAISDPISLYEPVYHSDDDAMLLLDQIHDTRISEEQWVNDVCLKDAFRNLDQREKNIVSLRYFQGKTQIEVSEEIGISQAQVSRLEKNAIKAMSEKF